MLGWPTVLGRFNLWLKVGLYIPIEPKFRGPITPTLEGGGGRSLGAGLTLFRSRYVPKMNEIRQTVFPGLTQFGKIGPQGAHCGPHNPLWGRGVPFAVGVYVIQG